jgi:hypothetical protein
LHLVGYILEYYYDERTHGRLNTVEFIQHYSSCNMVRPYCLETSNVANIQILDSVRSENNTE